MIDKFSIIYVLTKFTKKIKESSCNFNSAVFIIATTITFWYAGWNNVYCYKYNKQRDQSKKDKNILSDDFWKATLIFYKI